MKFRILGLAVLAMASCGKRAPEKPRDSAGPAKPESAVIHEKEIAEAAPGETGINPRTRPSQPPVKRDYPKPEIPFAEELPGKPGYVKSPFNGKIVDVQNIPPGTLVADPTYPPAEQRFFRTPLKKP